MKEKIYRVKVFTYDNIVVVFSVGLILITHILNFWAIDKGFISSDEGWYMYLFRNQVTETSTHAHLLFGHLPILNDIYINRLVCLFLRICSGAIFAYGISVWIRHFWGKVSFITVWGLMCLTTLVIESCSTLNYTQLADVVGLSSLGLLFLGLANEKWWQYFLCGVLMTLFFPIKITSLLLAPFVLITVLLCSDRGGRNCIYGIGGFGVGMTLYMLLIESPSEIYNWIKYAVSSSQNDRTHNPGALFMWCHTTIRYYFRWFMLAYLLMSLPVFVKKVSFLKSGFIRKAMIVSAGVLLIAYFESYVYPILLIRESHVQLKSYIWLCVIMVTVYSLYYTCSNKKKKSAILLLLVTPFCISFGTDVNFVMHHCTQYCSVILAIVPFLPQRYILTIKSLVLLLFILSVGFFIRSTRNLVDWQGNVYIKHTIPLRTIGINEKIKLNPDYIARIEFYKKQIPTGASVLASVRNWGVVHLLELNSLSPKFRVTNGKCDKLILNELYKKSEKVYLLYMHALPTDKERTWEELVEKLSADQRLQVEIKTQNDYSLATISLKRHL